MRTSHIPAKTVYHPVSRTLELISPCVPIKRWRKEIPSPARTLTLNLLTKIIWKDNAPWPLVAHVCFPLRQETLVEVHLRNLQAIQSNSLLISRVRENISTIISFQLKKNTQTRWSICLSVRKNMCFQQWMRSERALWPQFSPQSCIARLQTEVHFALQSLRELMPFNTWMVSLIVSLVDKPKLQMVTPDHEKLKMRKDPLKRFLVEIIILGGFHVRFGPGAPPKAAQAISSKVNELIQPTNHIKTLQAIWLTWSCALGNVWKHINNPTKASETSHPTWYVTYIDIYH